MRDKSSSAEPTRGTPYTVFGIPSLPANAMSVAISDALENG